MHAIVIAAFIALGFGSPAEADLRRQSIAMDGQTRSYLLYTPDSPAPAGGRPLVIVLHGGGGTARALVRSTRGRFNELAETNGSLVAYPDAIDRSWDFGEGVVSEAMTTRRDDLAFLSTMVRAIGQTRQLDHDRVFATGISRGGQASYFLACKRPGLLRAIAPVAMPLPDFLADDCRRVAPTPLLLMNGTDDPIVPYDGGPITIGRRERGDVLSTDATMEFFRTRNRCDPRTYTIRLGAVDRIEWRNCAAPTVLYRVNGGGHTWPGERSLLPAQIVGKTNRDISATDEIWKFFSAF